MRIVFAVPADDAAVLSADAARYGHETVSIAVDATAVAASVVATSPDIAVVAARPLYLTEAVLAQCDARGVRLIAAIASDFERRYASTLGLYETVDSLTDWSAFERAITGPGHAAPLSPRTEAGTVIAVWGPAGAPGRTTLAIGIAAELALAGYSVALGDVDTHGAAIAPALGILDEAPGFAAACRLAGASALNRSELERIGQQYSLGAASMWVLTGIGRPSRWPELSGERVRGAIEECRRWVDYTVLDTGFSFEAEEEISSDLFAPKRNGATIAALKEADRVIAVGSADPVGLARFLRAHVDLIEVCEPDRVSVVMNKVRASAIGLNASGQVTQTLSRFGGIEGATLVPWDQPGLDAAVLSGRALVEVAPKSPARLAIKQLVASRILGNRAPTLATRLLGRRMAAATARGGKS